MKRPSDALSSMPVVLVRRDNDRCCLKCPWCRTDVSKFSIGSYSVEDDDMLSNSMDVSFPVGWLWERPFLDARQLNACEGFFKRKLTPIHKRRMQCESDIDKLKERIDALEALEEELREALLSGGYKPAARIHLRRKMLAVETAMAKCAEQLKKKHTALLKSDNYQCPDWATDWRCHTTLPHVKEA